MRSRPWLLALAALLLGAVVLAGCGSSPQAQAEPGTISDILPTPPPMPQGPTPAPSAVPPPAPDSGPQAAAAPLLATSFDSPQATQGWAVIDAAEVLQFPSVWQVQDGRLAQVSDGNDLPGNYPSALVAGDTTWRDYRVAAAAFPTANDEIGVVGRAGEGGYYVLRLLPAAASGPRALLARYDAASTSFVTLASAEHAGFATGQWVRLELALSGQRLVGRVDGREVLSAQDATLTSGRAGVYGYAQGGLVFDNLSVLPSGN
jgi:hypothetical protein